MDKPVVMMSVLGTTFVEMPKPPMSDDDYCQRLDPKPLWIEKVVHFFSNLRAEHKQVSAGQTLFMSTQEPTES